MATFTVYKRTNKTGFTWQYDIKDKSFKSGKKRKAGFKTKAEATLAAQQVIKQLDKGLDIDENRTFEDYYNTWLKANNKHLLSKNQYLWYQRALVVFKEKFGENMLVKNIRRSDLQELYNEYGEGRTKESVRKIAVCINACLRDAHMEGYLDRDQTYNISIHGTKAPKTEESKYMKIQEYKDLIKYFKTQTDLEYMVLLILAITGARFSEVNRMTYEDINHKLGVMHLPGTKTASAARYVDVNPIDVELINKVLATYPKKMNGKPFEISNKKLVEAFNNAKKQIKFDDTHKPIPYSLRHTHASYLISKGIPIEYISKRLGHSNISITLNTYTHVLEEHRNEQANAVREIFSKMH